MNRRTLLAAASTVALILAIPAAGAASAGPWGTRADTLTARAVAADPHTTIADGPLQIGMLTVALAERRGWQDPTTQTYLDKLLALQYADGGFGLPYPYDAAKNGTVNPTGTSYTVSMAGHAGPALLAAYQAGVPGVEEPLERMVAKLWRTSYVAVTPGLCWAYSDSGYDGYCAHNVSAGAASFLVQAWQAGIGTVDPSWLVAGITQQEVSAFDRKLRNTRYMVERTNMSDAPHTAYWIDSMMTLAPGVGQNAASYHLSIPDTQTYWEFSRAWLAPWGCGKAAQWLDEFDAWTAGLTDFSLLAQAARVAAVAAKACD